MAEQKLSARDIHNALLKLEINRVIPGALETLELVPKGTAEFWFKKMAQADLLRPVPTDEPPTWKNLEAPVYDVVQPDGSVIPIKRKKATKRDRTSEQQSAPNPTVQPISPAWLETVRHHWKTLYSNREWVYVATHGEMFYGLALLRTADEPRRPRYIHESNLRYTLKKLSDDGIIENDHVCKARNTGTAYRWNKPPSPQAEQILAELLSHATKT